MAVKQVQSAGRVLATFEALARHQPIGVGALARLLGDDKSAVQRALTTLAAAGWIAPASDGGTGWELTNHLVLLVHTTPGGTLLDRARPVLEELRDSTGETAILNVADAGEIVVLDVAVSKAMLRTAPHVGLVVPAATSAAGRAILAHLPAAELARYLGEEPTDAFLEGLGRDRARGWSLNAGDIVSGASGVGAAVLDEGGRPRGSITLSVPTVRMPTSRQRELGAVVADAAAQLSK